MLHIPRLGRMIGLRDLSRLYASRSDMARYRMRYAMTTAEDLLIPASQCTTTFLLSIRALSVLKNKGRVVGKRE